MSTFDMNNKTDHALKMDEDILREKIKRLMFNK